MSDLDAPAARPDPGGPDSDWAGQAADAIERGVGMVRDKTAVPLDRAARFLVYGVLAGFLGLLCLVLLAIAAVRALDVLLPADVWAAHAVIGGIFTLAGLFVWSKRRRTSSD